MLIKSLCKLFLGIFISVVLHYLFYPGLYEIHITPSEIINPNSNYQAITGLEGAPEDIVIYKNIFLLSVRDTMAMWFKGIDKVKNGGIYCLYPPYDDNSGSKDMFKKIDKNQKNFEELELKGFPNQLRFFPFGMKVANNLLYVINQEPQNERVDIFTIQEQEVPENKLILSLIYKNSWILPNYLKGKTNNLAIVNDDSFFITTFKPTNIDLINQIYSHILFLKKTQVFFCKSNHYSEQVSCDAIKDQHANSEFNNGIEIDKYGRLYVAQLVSKKISVFQLDFDNLQAETTKFLKYIDVEGFPDNINYDPVNDQLYIGCTSKLGEFFKVAYTITKQGEIKDDFTIWGTIISIKNDPDVNKLVPKIILRQNHMIRGISAIAKIDQYFLAGTIIENRALLIKDN